MLVEISKSKTVVCRIIVSFASQLQLLAESKREACGGGPQGGDGGRTTSPPVHLLDCRFPAAAAAAATVKAQLDGDDERKTVSEQSDRLEISNRSPRLGLVNRMEQ